MQLRHLSKSFSLTTHAALHVETVGSEAHGDELEQLRVWKGIFNGFLAFALRYVVDSGCMHQMIPKGCAFGSGGWTPWVMRHFHAAFGIGAI